MTDLARLAGVSVATVSRSLNDSQLINYATKRRIWQIAADHGYVATREMSEALHVSLATLALVIPAVGSTRFSDPLIQDLLIGVAEAAREASCDLIISQVGPRLRDVHAIMNNPTVDAYLFFGQKELHDALAALDDQPFLVWGASEGAYSTIGPDNFSAGYKATQYLIGQGCRRVAYLGENDGPEMRDRFRGYLQALDEAGIRLTPDLLISHPGDGGFDGLFCATDGVAASLFQLPVGIHTAAIYHGALPVGLPPITCLSVDVMAAGRLIVSQLLAAATKNQKVSHRLPVRIS